MGRTYDTVSFLSDFGNTDEFAGVVKSVLRDMAPQVVVVDLTHGIPPFDVRAGALALARCVQYVPVGIVLAVVDPGVGTSRRAVAVEVGEGEGIFVGPDNGVLASAVAMAGGAGRAVELTDERYHLPAPGATFAARDIFAPCVAHLCNGVDLAELGPAVDAMRLTPGLVPVPRYENEQVVVEVLWVDHFGNAQLNIDAEAVEHLGEVVMVSHDDDHRAMSVVAAYGDLATGQFGLLVDSYGLLAIAANRQSAADELGLQPGDELILAEARD